MKVLHVTRDYPPRNHGGLSSAVSGWVRAHALAGIEAAVVSFDAYRPRRGQAASVREDDTGGVPTLRVEGAIPHEPLLAFARAEEIGLVHLHDPLLHEPATALRNALDVPLVFSVHLLQQALVELRGLEQPTASALAERAAIEAADLVTAPCPSAAQRVCTDHDLPQGAVHVVPLSIAPAAAPASLERPSPPTVLFAGRFADVKGVTDFLEAAALVATRHADVRFELAGGLPASPRSERRFVRKHLDDLPPSLAERVRWLGYCDAAALDAAYHRARVMVAPSWTETFGQCAFEALARATPLITTNVGAYADYLQHGRECLHVAPRNAHALSMAMSELLDDEPLRRALAKRAPETATRFAPERTGQTLHALYGKAEPLCDPGGPRG